MRLLSSVPCFVAFVTLFFVSGVSANAVHGHPPPLTRAAVMANATLITWAPKQALPFIILGNKIYTSALTPVMSLPDDMGGVEYARWNETGARVLVGDKEMLVLIDFPHRRVLHVWPQTSDACWTSEGILRISSSASGEYTLQVGSQEAAVPKHMQVQATTDDGSCLLGWKSQPSVNGAPAHLNAALLFRTHGAKFIVRPVRSIRWDVGSKNPYGDRLVAAGREMVISAGATGMRDKTYVELYSVNLDTMRSRHLLYSDGAVSSYLTNYKGAVYGAFHRSQHLTPLQKPAYSQIAIRNGVIRRQRDLSSSSVCYGHSKTSNREAYLNLAGNVLTIRVCESGRQIAEYHRFVAPNR